MSENNDADALIDRLADLAASRRVPRGPDPEALLREAGIVGRARARTAQRRRLAVMGGIGGLALALTLAFARPRSPDESIEELALGPHTVAMASGTALAVDALGERTAIRVDDGRALFDVAPLPARASFEVITPDASIRVVGTVFAVGFVDEHTEVEVFEGVVEVERDGHTTRLVAGERLDGRSEALATLAARGQAAAARRGARNAEAGSEAAESGARAEDAVAEDGAEEDGAEEDGAEEDGAEEDILADDARTEADRRPRTPSEGETGEPARALQDTASDTRAPSIDLATLRALCDRGEFAAALAALEGARPPRGERGEWALLEGDAARATGDLARAADAYERAADALTPSRAALAGFLAASTHERLGDIDAALSVLDRAHAADRGSPLEERALAMRASLLARTGRTRESHEAARRYLASFPGGEASARMEALLE